MRRRLRKQVSVLLVIGAFFGSVGALIFAVVYEPPPPPPPPPPHFAPLAVRSTEIFRSPPSGADLLAIAQNPNANAGVRKVAYTFELRLVSGAVTTFQGETFFLPGQEKPLALLNLQIPEAVTDVRLTFQEPEWVLTGPEFRGPALLTVSRESAVRSGPVPVYEMKGVLANESDLDFLTVEVTVLGVDAEGTTVGVGRTFIGLLRARERREFTVSWPLPEGTVVAEVRIFPEVNVFSPEAVQLRPGLPGDASGVR